MAPIAHKSQPLSEWVLTDWQCLVRRAKEQQFKAVGSEERALAGLEAIEEVYSRGIVKAIEKALASRWIDPLGQRPLGYILRLEEMRKMEVMGTGPWAENASIMAFRHTGRPTSSK
ncbi:uncharacterized protein PV09_05156 [Verruconis gallopava]|uniref:Uncharacterized protein n=1 Tax=Verruconis gallopava TaxID=253628 RepID=A0A0D2AAQ2_9PEZI|nr:uncharacterized protein PV09_05156 [Verruconis gallopava]KIW03858.1 hypothetical protein PV09_05156 [Verruconis gallopava]